MLPPGFGRQTQFRTTPGGAILQRALGGNWYRAGWQQGYGPHMWGAPAVGGPQNAGLPGHAAKQALEGFTPTNIDVFPGVGRVAGIRTPGYAPNYDYLIQNDPGYLAQHALGQEALSGAASTRDAALRALQYDYSGNPYSQMQEILRAYEQDRASGLNQLAGRGALHSGETPYLEDNLSHRRSGQEYAAGKTYAAQVAQALQAYLGTQRQVAGQEAQSISDAASRLQDNPLYQPSQGYAQLVDAARGVYQDMQGNQWILDAYGNPQRIY